ncbi:hypothetical protein [Streptomyces sp. NPDC060187]|uniref:hypothetical protein n=1 Tax=Streptomyces sp. NPDC060187 TaxID=3347067 RepID=UPI00365550E6
MTEEKISPAAREYGQALRELVPADSISGKFIAERLGVSVSKVSRFFSGKMKTVASEAELDQIIELVRQVGVGVTSAQVAELHRLRRRAQDASKGPTKKADLLTGRVNQLSTQLLESKRSAEELQRQVEQAEAGRAADTAEFAAALDAGSRELAGLREQLKRARAAEAASSSVARHRRSQIDALRAAVREAEAAREADVAAVNAALRESRDSLRELRDKLEAAESRNAQLQQQVTVLTRELRSAREQAAHWQRTAERAEWGAEASLAQLQKQLKAASEYARDSDALIDEQLRLLSEREAENRQLRSRIDVLERTVHSYVEEETRRTEEARADTATQVKAGASTTKRARVDTPATADDRRPAPAPPVRKPSGGDHRPQSRPTQPAGAAPPLGSPEWLDLLSELPEAAPAPSLRPAKASTWLKRIWDTVLALTLGQLVALTVLGARTCITSAKTPESRDILLAIGAVLCGCVLAFLGWLFSASDKAAQAAPVLCLLCALTAGFGSDLFGIPNTSLTIPVVADIAHSAGIELAERGDGKTCDTSFCQTQ